MPPARAQSRNQVEKARRVMRARESLVLRTQGYSPEEIGKKLNVTASTVRRYVSQALAEVQLEPLEDVRSLEMVRLDREFRITEDILAVWLPRALGVSDDEDEAIPSMDAARTVLDTLAKRSKIRDQRWRWSGLEAPAVAAEPESRSEVDRLIIELVEEHKAIPVTGVER